MSDHIPVLLKESCEILLPALVSQSDITPILMDCSIGCAGHSLEFFRATKGNLFLLGIDVDDEILKMAEENLMRGGVPEKKFKLVRANFEDVDAVLDDLGISEVSAVFYDVGFNSVVVENAERGFSLMKDGLLDMRFDRRLKVSAADLVNSLSGQELKEIFWKFGGERRAKFLSDVIVKKRLKSPIRTTKELAELVEKFTPRKLKQTGHLHPATKIFQALRIAVNRELEVLEKSLKKVLGYLKALAHVAVITYHSGEDKIVKDIFRTVSRSCSCPPEQPFCSCGGKPAFKVLTPHPIVPTIEEVYRNPRARSGKLRAICKLHKTEKIKKD